MSSQGVVVVAQMNSTRRQRLSAQVRYCSTVEAVGLAWPWALECTSRLATGTVGHGELSPERKRELAGR
jgi:hypothetical protein